MQYDVQRGCGYLKKGMIYSQVDTVEGGKPISYFIIDPPIEIDPDALGISAQGVSLLPRLNPITGQPALDVDGAQIYDIWDWVGTEYYPEVSDFVEEVRSFGLSRLTPKSIDYSKLSPASCHILLHKKAILDDASKRFIYEWSETSNMGAPKCLKKIPIHDHPDADFLRDINDTCSKMWYHTKGKTAEDRILQIDLPGGVSYQMIGHPKFAPEYTLGAFMQFPVGFFSVVVDKVENKHEEALKALETLGRALQPRIRVINPDGNQKP
jgi:hypothetical protein